VGQSNNERGSLIKKTFFRRSLYDIK